MDSLQHEPSLSLHTELLEAPAWAAAGGLNGGAAPAPSLQQLPLGSQKLVPLLSWSLG